MAKSCKRGRPVEKPEPDPIPDSPENVLHALVTAPPRGEDEWYYLKQAADNCPTGDT